MFYAPGAQIFLDYEQKFLYRALGAILPLMKIFLLPLEIESTPDETNPGHASVNSNQYFNIFSFQLIYWGIIIIFA